MTSRSFRWLGAAIGLCVALAAFVILAGAGCTRQGVQVQAARPAAPQKLVIITPHSSMIRDLFQTEFSDWHHKKHGRYVDIRWIPMGTVE